MIGWYCNTCRFNGTWNKFTNKGLKDLTFFDIDVPFTLATTCNEGAGGIPSISAPIEISYKQSGGIDCTPAELNAVLGDDYSSVYQITWSSYDLRYRKYAEMAYPSIFKAYPKVIEDILNGTGSRLYGFYIPSKKLLLGIWSDGLSNIFKLVDDIFINIGLPTQNVFTPSVNCYLGYTEVFIVNYSSGFDYNDPSNYKVLYSVNNTENTRRAKIFTFTNNNTFNRVKAIGAALFGDGGKPDFDIIHPPDPYKPGGETEPGGGEGDFDNTSDPIDFPPMPTLSAVDTGFLTLFNPTVEQLKNLSSYMWSDLFDIEGWKKIFANPMDAILGLTIVPVAVPNAGTGVVSVGNISTGISMNKASGQYIEVDCGTLNVNEYWGAYLDYDPYTKAEIYLPFIGIHALSTDDIMNKAVHIKYHIDLLSGACCAYVKCGNSVLYSFVGQCSCSVPTTSSDWTNIINGALSIAGAIGSMVATGGASAPMAAGTIASAAVNALKPTIEKSGSMGGMGGMLGVQQPYIILTRPRQALPTALNTYSGYPSFMTKGLGELSGYTVVDSIHLENVPATGAELSEIESLLKEGVIL